MLHLFNVNMSFQCGTFVTLCLLTFDREISGSRIHQFAEHPWAEASSVRFQASELRVIRIDQLIVFALVQSWVPFSFPILIENLSSRHFCSTRHCFPQELPISRRTGHGQSIHIGKRGGGGSRSSRSKLNFAGSGCLERSKRRKASWAGYRAGKRTETNIRLRA